MEPKIVNIQWVSLETYRPALWLTKSQNRINAKGMILNFLEKL